MASKIEPGADLKERLGFETSTTGKYYSIFGILTENMTIVIFTITINRKGKERWVCVHDKKINICTSVKLPLLCNSILQGITIHH